MSVSQHQIDPLDNSVPRLRKFEVLISSLGGLGPG